MVELNTSTKYAEPRQVNEMCRHGHVLMALGLTIGLSQRVRPSKMMTEMRRSRMRQRRWKFSYPLFVAEL
eukprot:15441558-Heterocapsa_arctica.AAC.1